MKTTDLRGETYINSRDLFARLKDLQAIKDAAVDDETGLDEDETEELAALEAIKDELPAGETLILADRFEDYARELAEDIGAISRDAQWPLTHIDWEAAAEELQHDYTTIEFGEYTYLMRSR